MKSLRIAIAGCGIAGLTAALLLSRRGHHVHLFDQFEKPQPVGSGFMLQPTGMAVLHQLGLAGEALALGARIDGLWGLNQAGKMALSANYADLRKGSCFGVGIHRASLFDLLHDKVQQAGIEISANWKVQNVQRQGNAIHLLGQHGQASEKFDLVVDALGLHSPLTGKPVTYLPFGALWANVNWPQNERLNINLLEQRYCDAKQMIGLLPIGRRNSSSPEEAAFFWSIRGEDYAAWRAASLDDWKREVTHLWPECAAILGQISSHDDLTFARYAHRTLRQPVAERLIHIGDAWHSASPQLGQGANMAMLDAWSLALGLEQGSNIQESLRMAARWREDHVQLYQWITAFFTPFFQSSSKLPSLARDWITAPLSRYWPAKQIQTLLLSGLFGAPLPQLGLSVPDYSVLEKTAL